MLACVTISFSLCYAGLRYYFFQYHNLRKLNIVQRGVYEAELKNATLLIY